MSSKFDQKWVNASQLKKKLFFYLLPLLTYSAFIAARFSPLCSETFFHFLCSKHHIEPDILDSHIGNLEPRGRPARQKISVKLIQRKIWFQRRTGDAAGFSILWAGLLRFLTIQFWISTTQPSTPHLIIMWKSDANSTLSTFQLGFNRIFHLIRDVKEGILKKEYII